MNTIKLREEYIKLGQALKAAGLVDSGVAAKYAIEDGLVKVNGQTEYQRGKSSMEVMWLSMMATPSVSRSNWVRSHVY